MQTEEQKLVHKEFRKYLRTKEGHKDNMLNTLINATEVSLPALIRRYVRPDFECIYDDIYSIEEMLKFAAKLKSDEILAGQSGYISWKAIDAYIRFYAQKHEIDLTAIKQPKGDAVENAEESEDEEQERFEGRLTEAKVLRRQRNRAARQQCLEASGYTCYVCGFNFEKAYGDVGKNFLEVHHTKPLATYDDEHPIPQSELVALCSNCHSMVHRKREVLDVDELKVIFNRNLNKH
jgi:predicted HNH restriction endonuclease